MNKQIELARQARIKKYKKEITFILEALGHPEALVTDESKVSDMLCVVDEKEADKELKILCDLTHLKVEKKQYIADVAERLHIWSKDIYVQGLDNTPLWKKIIQDIPYWFPFKQVHDIKYYLKNLIFRRHHLIRTKLPKGQWYDTDTRLLYGMMNLLIEYLEKEKPFEIVNWDSDEDHKKARDEMIAIRDWWLNYDNRKKEIEKALDEWHSKKFVSGDHWIRDINAEDTPEVKVLFDKLHALEAKLLEEEEEMLIRLVKIRGYLWT